TNHRLRSVEPQIAVEVERRRNERRVRCKERYREKIRPARVAPLQKASRLVNCPVGEVQILVVGPGACSPVVVSNPGGIVRTRITVSRLMTQIQRKIVLQKLAVVFVDYHFLIAEPLAARMLVHRTTHQSRLIAGVAEDLRQGSG